MIELDQLRFSKSAAALPRSSGAGVFLLVPFRTEHTHCGGQKKNKKELGGCTVICFEGWVCLSG